MDTFLESIHSRIPRAISEKWMSKNGDLKQRKVSYARMNFEGAYLGESKGLAARRGFSIKKAR